MTPRAIDKSRWPRLSPLLDELLDMVPADQAHRLAQLRQQDSTLADDLQAMLGLHDALDEGAFLNAPALPAPSADLAGQAVGSYRLLRLLGEGGMGSVWLAQRDDGRYQGQVAIKFMQDSLLGQRDARRFLREGQLLARLDHPHIARLLDAGVLQPPGSPVSPGRPYLVLDFVDGQPIDTWCDQRQLGLRDRVRLMLQVLSAVAHAHSRLILHRDLKPSNILVTADGSPKLLDFGIGKLLQDSRADTGAPPNTELTREAGRAYTERYAAPEQLLGQEVTTATDVYALGVLLYGLLGGGHPTEPPKGTPLSRLQAAVELVPPRLSDAARRHALGAGQPATARQVRQWRQLRGDLDTVLARALKKLPAERYPNAAALADDLRRWLDHEPVTARRDSTGYRLGRWVRRHGRLVGVGATAGVAALSVGVAAALWQAHRADTQRNKAEQLVAFMLGDLKDKLNQLGRVDLLQAVGQRALDYYGADDLGGLGDDDLARRAQALRVVGDTARLRQDVQQARQGFTQAADTTAQLLARSPRQVSRLLDHADSLSKLEEMATVHGDPAAGLALSRRQHELLQQAMALAPQDNAVRLKAITSTQGLAYNLTRTGQPQAALPLLAQAEQAYAGLPAGLPGLAAGQADKHINDGLALVALGRYVDGAKAFDAALKGLDAIPDIREDAVLQRQRAMVRRSFARASLNAGQLGAAGQVAGTMLADLQAQPASTDRDAPLVMENLNDRLLLAEVLWLAGQHGTARQLLAQMVDQVQRLGPVNGDHQMWHVRTLGNLLAVQQRLHAGGEAGRDGGGNAGGVSGGGAGSPAGQPPSIHTLQQLMDRVQREEAAGRPQIGLALQYSLQVGLALGDALAQAGRADAARAQWQAVVRRGEAGAKAGFAPAMLHLAQAWQRLGQPQSARLWVDRLQATDFRHPDLAVLQQQLPPASAAPTPVPAPTPAPASAPAGPELVAAKPTS